MVVDATGTYAWPAGRRLARDLSRLVDCRGQRVADLGCGTGVVGLAALALHAASVAFCDGNPQALAVASAGCAGNQRASFHLHAWGDALPGAPYPLILGGDILYLPERFAALFDSIAASLGRDGMCLLADPRRQLEEALFTLATQRGLSATAQRGEDLTVLRLGWAG